MKLYSKLPQITVGHNLLWLFAEMLPPPCFSNFQKRESLKPNRASMSRAANRIGGPIQSS